LIVGAPLSGFILGLDGVAGLHGWQWLFLIEGLPAILIAFAILGFLPDGPALASWLTSDEKGTIAARLAADAPAQHDLWAALRDPRLFVLGLVGGGVLLGLYGSTLWLPQIVQAMGFSNLSTGLIVAVPYLVTIGAMVAWGRSSDAKRERIWHIALAALISAAGFAVAGFAQSSLISLIALTFAVFGVHAAIAPLNSLPSEFLGGEAAAGGIALYGALANLGGFLGPTIIGALKQQTGGYGASMVALSLALVLSAAIVLAFGRVMAGRMVAPENMAGV
jgi:ACS family tartrate transporter-like MFS transporter